MSLPECPPRLAAQQRAFAAHLRDPRQPAPAEVDERRLAVYRTLFFNTIDGLLAGNFPVIRSLFDEAGWHALVRDFYREHASRTPLFPEIGREFVRYLDARAADGRGDPPFLVELAHYEWVELALAIDDSEPDRSDIDADGDLLEGAVVLSPLAWPFAYRYPVHRIRADFRPLQAPAQPTCLLLVRGRDDVVRFKQIDLLGLRLLQALDADPPRRGREVLTALAAEAGSDDVAGFIRRGAELLAQLREREAILGTRRGG